MNAAIYMVHIDQVEVVKESDTVRDTIAKMKNGSFKTLPVVNEASHFTGIIHEGKIYEAYFYNKVNKDEFLKAEIRPLVKQKIESVQKHTDFLELIE